MKFKTYLTKNESTKEFGVFRVGSRVRTTSTEHNTIEQAYHAAWNIAYFHTLDLNVSFIVRNLRKLGLALDEELVVGESFNDDDLNEHKYIVIKRIE